MLKKARLLTRPTLARRDAPCPNQGRSSAADPRFTFNALRFTAPGSEARTPLADFFSILLGFPSCRLRFQYPEPRVLELQHQPLSRLLK